MRSRPLAALALGASLALCACPGAKPKPDVVWPLPPDVPRIRFVEAFRGAEDLDTSVWAGLRRVLFGTAGGPVLGQPMGLALSADGKRLYIADHGNFQLLRVDLASRRIDQLAADEEVGRPFNVALDREENLYVSDPPAGLVRVFTRDGRPIRAIGRGQLERPTGLAVDAERGLLYVADGAHRTSENHRVRVFSLEGKWLRDLGGGKGTEDGQWYFPSYLALDAAGDVFVADTMNFRVQQFDAAGKFVARFGENGDGPGTFSRLKGLAFDGFGNLYAVDGGHSNVQIFNRAFQPLMFFGGYASKLEYFDVPSCIAIDRARNRIYVCNEFMARINTYELINTAAEDSANPKASPGAAQEGETDR